MGAPVAAVACVLACPDARAAAPTPAPADESAMPAHCAALHHVMAVAPASHDAAVVRPASTPVAAICCDLATPAGDLPGGAVAPTPRAAVAMLPATSLTSSLVAVAGDRRIVRTPAPPPPRGRRPDVLRI